jgi:hypothetical protein
MDLCIPSRCRGNEELLEVLVSMRSMSYRRKVGDHFFPEILVIVLPLLI